jgi:RNA polymerase sigma factor (sigma-70 family)
MSFRSTRWSVVARAGGGDPASVREALAALFEAYSYPLYAYARRRGLAPEDAEEAVQDLFAGFLANGSLAGADRARGRFRAYLLGALSHAIGHRERAARALRRGGGRAMSSLDAGEAERRYSLEPEGGDDPARLFDTAWARALLERAFARLHEEYAARGDGRIFERLRSHLVADDGASLAEVAVELGTNVGAVKTAVHRLRKRFRAALETEIGGTVRDPAEIDDEIRVLLAALGG